MLYPPSWWFRYRKVQPLERFRWLPTQAARSPLMSSLFWAVVQVKASPLAFSLRTPAQTELRGMERVSRRWGWTAPMLPRMGWFGARQTPTTMTMTWHGLATSSFQLGISDPSPRRQMG